MNSAMHLSRHTLHLWIIMAAIALGLLVFLMPKPTHSQTTPGYYTTTGSTNSSAVTTTTTRTSVTRNRTDRNDDYWRARGYERGSDNETTSDIEARYPYDNTGGRNRSDVDAVRTGFDDPRNPWDGRYTNDNPANSRPRGTANETVNGMRGNEAYRPGRYGTTAVHTRD